MTLLEEVNQLANRLMNTDFVYKGETYNMIKSGWKFQFNDNKTRLGLCHYKRGKIVGTLYLSKWIILNSIEPIETWKDTMLHEIAHAIDRMRRGKSDHSYLWVNIARSIGCNGKRTKKVNYGTIENPISKYTLKCGTCGTEKPSHKKRSRKVSCSLCCPNRYNEKFILEQIQNY